MGERQRRTRKNQIGELNVSPRHCTPERRGKSKGQKRRKVDLRKLWEGGDAARIENSVNRRGGTMAEQKATTTPPEPHKVTKN